MSTEVPGMAGTVAETLAFTYAKRVLAFVPAHVPAATTQVLHEPT